jgi:hypothetical protein
MLVSIILGFFSSVIAVLLLFLYRGCLRLCENIAVSTKNGKYYYKFKIFNKGLFKVHNIEIDAALIKRSDTETNVVDKVIGHLHFVNDCVWELPGIFSRGTDYKNGYRFVSNGDFRKNNQVKHNCDLRHFILENPNIFLKVRIKYSAPLTGLTKTFSHEFLNPFREGDFRKGMNCDIVCK